MKLSTTQTPSSLKLHPDMFKLARWKVSSSEPFLETVSPLFRSSFSSSDVYFPLLDTKKENDYRSALLLSCYDSSSTDTLFNILARRFHEMGKVQSVQARIDRQYRYETTSISEMPLLISPGSILSILIWWLSQPAYHIDADVVWQMRSFCDTILPNLTSPTMVDKVYDLLENIKLRVCAELSNLIQGTYCWKERDVASSIRTTVSRRLLERESPPPKELAIALTLIEAERFEQLTPYDYLMFLRDPASDSGVKVACRIHNDVMRWVKEFVLDYDEVEVRASVINIFIDTAAVSFFCCLAMHRGRGADAVRRNAGNSEICQA